MLLMMMLMIIKGIVTINSVHRHCRAPCPSELRANKKETSTLFTKDEKCKFHSLPLAPSPPHPPIGLVANGRMREEKEPRCSRRHHYQSISQLDLKTTPPSHPSSQPHPPLPHSIEKGQCVKKKAREFDHCNKVAI